MLSESTGLHQNAFAALVVCACLCWAARQIQSDALSPVKSKAVALTLLSKCNEALFPLKTLDLT